MAIARFVRRTYLRGDALLSFRVGRDRCLLLVLARELVRCQAARLNVVRFIRLVGFARCGLVTSLSASPDAADASDVDLKS